MSKDLHLAKRYIKDATRKKSKGKKRDITKQFMDLRKAVRHVIAHLEKVKKSSAGK
jgi:hypothetical protein